jgi:hypothetical protein
VRANVRYREIAWTGDERLLRVELGRILGPELLSHIAIPPKNGWLNPTRVSFSSAIERGPWQRPVDRHLRLRGCIDVAGDEFPEQRQERAWDLFLRMFIYRHTC